ncbi:MAG: hypothetical protein VXZ53_11120 [Planctomycetota bacterium]|nr:hypothetical protein [Planctomycetota bacterium]
MVRKPREIGRGAIKEVAQLPQAHHGDYQQRLSTATLNRESQQQHGGILIFDLRFAASTMSPSEKVSGPKLFHSLANPILQQYR